MLPAGLIWSVVTESPRLRRHLKKGEECSKGSDFITKKKAPGILDGLCRGQVPGHALEEGRALDVGGLGVPRVQLALGSHQLVPPLVAGGDLGVDLLEHGGDDVLLLHGLDLLPAGPDVPQEDGLVVGVVAQGLGLEVDVHAA